MQNSQVLIQLIHTSESNHKLHKWLSFLKQKIAEFQLIGAIISHQQQESKSQSMDDPVNTTRVRIKEFMGWLRHIQAQTKLRNKAHVQSRPTRTVSAWLEPAHLLVNWAGLFITCLGR